MSFRQMGGGYHGSLVVTCAIHSLHPPQRDRWDCHTSAYIEPPLAPPPKGPFLGSPAVCLDPATCTPGHHHPRKKRPDRGPPLVFYTNKHGALGLLPWVFNKIKFIYHGLLVLHAFCCFLHLVSCWSSSCAGVDRTYSQIWPMAAPDLDGRPF